MKQEFGERISEKDAEKYIKAYEEINDSIKSDKPMPTPSTSGQGTTDIASVYKKSPKNAFIFDKDLVINMLTQYDDQGNSPDYLMVHFAAKSEDGEGFVNGDPTLVILGCRKSTKKTANGITFLSMDVIDPGAEQPGGRTEAVFPPASDPLITNKSRKPTKSIQFTFEM